MNIASAAFLLFLVMDPLGNIPFFLSAIIGVALAGTWFNARVAARCPVCGGRAYCVAETRGHRRYRCRDCGHEVG